MARIPETETGQVWRAMREARVRSLYFGELASRAARRQLWVQGLSLAFGSAACVALVGGPGRSLLQRARRRRRTCGLRPRV